MAVSGAIIAAAWQHTRRRQHEDLLASSHRSGSLRRAQFARCGWDVSVQYGASQPEYDLVAVDGDRVLKVSVKGSKDGSWGLTQSFYRESRLPWRCGLLVEEALPKDGLLSGAVQGHPAKRTSQNVSRQNPWRSLLGSRLLRADAATRSCTRGTSGRRKQDQPG